MRSSHNLLVAGCLCVIAAAATLHATTLTYTDDLFLRLDGSHVTADANGISTWNNQASGVGVSADFTQIVVPDRPALVANAISGKSALEFDGAADHLYNLADTAWEWDYDSNAADAARWTTFFVCKPDVTAANRFLLRSAYNDFSEGVATAANTALWGVWFDDNDYSVHCRNSAGSWLSANWLDAVDTQWHIIAGRIQNVVDPSIVLYRDGAVAGTQVQDTTRQMGGHVRSRIGASTTNPTANEFFDGQLAEVLVYKEALSAWQIAEVNGYLAVKYGFADDIVSNLVLHCRMDDDSVSRGTTEPPPALHTDDGDWTVSDWTTPTNDGTVTSENTGGNVVSSVAGVIDEAIRFSDAVGGNRHVDFGLAPSLEPGTGSLSVSLWLKSSLMGGVQFVASHGNRGSANNGWSIWTDGATTLRFRCNSGNINANANKAEVSFTVADDTWYHAVLVLDRNGNKLRAYLNGTTEGAVNNATWTDAFSADSIGSSGFDLLLGVRNDLAAEWKGDLDGFAVWKRALTANEVSAIYAMGKAGKSFIEVPSGGTLFIIR